MIALGFEDPDWRKMAAGLMELESWPASPPISLLRAAIPKVKARVQYVKDQSDPTVGAEAPPIEDETQAEPEAPEPYDPEGFKDEPESDSLALKILNARLKAEQGEDFGAGGGDGDTDTEPPSAFDPETGELLNDDMDQMFGGDE